MWLCLVLCYVTDSVIAKLVCNDPAKIADFHNIVLQSRPDTAECIRVVVMARHHTLHCDELDEIDGIP
mgnify:CR=1 FL=1